MNVVVKTKISYILERVFSWGFFTFFGGGGNMGRAVFQGQAWMIN